MALIEKSGRHGLAARFVAAGCGRNIRSLWRVALVGGFMATAPNGLTAERFDAGAGHSDANSIETYTQVLAVTRDDGGAVDAPAFAPVYDGRRWALSTRWDDSNPNALNVRRKMLESGIRGTFYLNSRKPERPEDSLACALTKDGECSVGGHTVSHPRLPELPANDAFRELMANRITLECLTDRPVNSLAFPYGAYRDKNRTEVKHGITEAVLRSGYHHCVYASFVRKNDYLPENALSTGLQVRPGDRQVDAEAFWAQLEKIRRFETAYRETSDCIFLGVHPWQKGDELDKLGAVMAQMKEWDDFWHCTQTEYAAFVKQRRHSAVHKIGPNTLRITRPCAYEVGSDVALTLVFDTDAVHEVTVDGMPCDSRVVDGKTIVNVPHAPLKGIPRRIDQTKDGASAEFPGLQATVSFDPRTGTMTYAMTNSGTEPLADLALTFSLPPAFDPGIIRRTRADLAAGETWRCSGQATQVRTSDYWRKGKDYAVGQLDFLLTGERGRLFTTCVAP